jgi:hypothetical protein
MPRLLIELRLPCAFQDGEKFLTPGAKMRKKGVPSILSAQLKRDNEDCSTQALTLVAESLLFLVTALECLMAFSSQRLTLTIKKNPQAFQF